MFLQICILWTIYNKNEFPLHFHAGKSIYHVSCCAGVINDSLHFETKLPV